MTRTTGPKPGYLSVSQARALKILVEHGPIRPREFAKLMWPDSPGWRRPAKCGQGSHRGGGMYASGGAYLGRLVRAGLAVYGYGISDAGRKALATTLSDAGLTFPSLSP